MNYFNDHQINKDTLKNFDEVHVNIKEKEDGEITTNTTSTYPNYNLYGKIQLKYMNQYKNNNKNYANIIQKNLNENNVCFGTIDSWLIFNLTNKLSHVTDVSNASRTLLMNIKELEWDEEILKELNIPNCLLPQILPSASGRYGTINCFDLNNSEEASYEEEFPLDNYSFQNDDFFDQNIGEKLSQYDLVKQNIIKKLLKTYQNILNYNGISLETLYTLYEYYHGVPITGVLGDQQAALFGQTCFQEAEAKCTYGTGAFLLVNTGEDFVPSDSGLLSTISYMLEEDDEESNKLEMKKIEDENENRAPLQKKNYIKLKKNKSLCYALEGAVAYSGSILQWLRDNQELFRDVSEINDIIGKVHDNGGLYFVPAFNGLFCPYWREDARAVITGITTYNTKSHLVRAGLEASAYQIIEIIHTIEREINNFYSNHSNKEKRLKKINLQSLKVDGGLTNNNFIMQFQSDLLNIPLILPLINETTALGAAFISSIGSKKYKDLEVIKTIYKKKHTWNPSMSEYNRNKLIYYWKKALARSFYWNLNTQFDEKGYPIENKETEDPFLKFLEVGSSITSSSSTSVSSNEIPQKIKVNFSFSSLAIAAFAGGLVGYFLAKRN